MNKLETYSISPINRITIKYGKEEIRFNLWDELKISEQRINIELKKQPSKYGFLLMLYGKLKTQFELEKSDRRAVYGRLWAKAKKRISSSTHRVYSDDAAEIWVEAHKEYRMATARCIHAKDKVDQLWAAVKAFEQRKDVIQSLSSNIRNENK